MRGWRLVWTGLGWDGLRLRLFSLHHGSADVPGRRCPARARGPSTRRGAKPFQAKIKWFMVIPAAVFPSVPSKNKSDFVVVALLSAQGRAHRLLSRAALACRTPP